MTTAERIVDTLKAAFPINTLDLEPEHQLAADVTEIRARCEELKWQPEYCFGRARRQASVEFVNRVLGEIE